IRVGVSLRAAPPGIAALVPGAKVAGRVLPARHYGSVDVFLEAFEASQRGDVLIVDNGGRDDEACIGDLAVLEAAGAGLAGVVVWVSTATATSSVRSGFHSGAMAHIRCHRRGSTRRPLMPLAPRASAATG